MTIAARRGARRLGLVALLVLAASLTAVEAPASTGPSVVAPSAGSLVLPGFQDTEAIKGLTNPTTIEFASDGRVFVAEKAGIIKVFDDLDDPTATVFADLTTNVYGWFDRGLLGMALDPDFPAEPYVYVLYTYDAPPGETAPYWNDQCPDPPGATADGCLATARLSRLQAVGDVMVGAEQVLIGDEWCQQFPSHSIGQLAFGNDGALYASAGDGASFSAVDYGQNGIPLNPCGDPSVPIAGQQAPPAAEGGALRSQDLRTGSDPASLDGTIIRVDPDTGDAFPGNPAFGDPDPNVARIIAYGLRNPYRFAFRPGTNEIWIGDVGWRSHEEINVIDDATDRVVENFGWPCYEGPAAQPSYDSLNLTICEDLYDEPNADTAPIFTYEHSTQVVPGETCDLDSAVTGVEFYGTGTYPDEYDGALFFTDYARRCIWAMLPDAGGVPDPGNVVNFVTDAQSAVDLEIGPGGDLFYVALAAGQIRRISYTGGPTAVAAASPTNGALPLLVNFDGTGSTAIVPGALTYAWDLDGDGQYDDSSEAQPSHTYTSAATIPVGLRVTDAGGATDTDSIDITAGNTAPTPVIDTPDAGTTWEVGEVISFSGHATDPDDGALPETSLSWSVILHHCGEGCHTHPIEDFAGVAGADFPAPDHEYPSYLELQLTATDLGGLSSTTSLALQPRSVELTFQSSPSGLQIAVGSEAATTPFTRTVIVGSSNSISATTPQSLSGTTYEFVSWSDGGAQSHDITAPSTSASYTATYVPVVTVNVTDFRFMPRRVNVANGTIVRWNFIGPSTHTVTSTLFNSGPIGPGGSFSYTVTSNRIRYSCTIHPTMTGNIKLI